MNERLRPLAARIESFIRFWLAEPQRARRIYPALLLLVTFFAWFPSLFTGLDLGNPDDFYHITQAALHHTPEDIAGWFTRGYWAYTHYEYRPLTRLSLLINYLLAGPRPWAYHLGNVLLHFLCVYLLTTFLVQAGATLWAARLSGLIAAVFPPGQMAVSWINGRQDLLCAVFLLAGVCLFANWLSGRPWLHLVGAALCVLLSALAKEPGAAAPLFLLAMAFLLPGKRSIESIGIPVGQERELLPPPPGRTAVRPYESGETFTRDPIVIRFAGVIAVCLALVPYTYFRLQAWPLDQYTEQNAFQLRGLDVAISWFFNDLMIPRLHELVKVWWPQKLLIFFSPRFSRLFVEQIAFWAGLLMLLRNQRRLLALGLAWKAVFYLPVYNLYWNPAFTHYRYLPNLGTAWLVGLAAWELAGWASARLHRLGRPLIRWTIVGLSLLLLLRFYLIQLDRRWPPWSLVMKGGPTPPVSFTRDLKGKDAPRFDDAAIYPPGERP